MDPFCLVLSAFFEHLDRHEKQRKNVRSPIFGEESASTCGRLAAEKHAETRKATKAHLANRSTSATVLLESAMSCTMFSAACSTSESRSYMCWAIRQSVRPQPYYRCCSHVLGRCSVQHASEQECTYLHPKQCELWESHGGADITLGKGVHLRFHRVEITVAQTATVDSER